MITEPFRRCPNCAAEAFGVLLINNDRYTRRCRNCWHSGQFPLPRLKRRVIYLDQFVVSNLMKLVTPTSKGHESVKADSFWQELHRLLKQLRELQLIVCPYSGSHENESLLFEFGNGLKKMYEDLGSGNSFVPFDNIKSKQIGELARAWAERRKPLFIYKASDVLTREPNAWNERFYITVNTNPFVSISEIRRVRKEIYAQIEVLFTKVWKVEQRTFAYWYEQERLGYQGWLGRAWKQSQQQRAESLAAYVEGEEIPLERLDAILPSFPERLVQQIRHIIRFPRHGPERSVEERKTLEETFGATNQIANAPFVKLTALMFAAIAMRSRTQTKIPDEGTTTDIEIVAHLMPYCDAMFIDNGCRSLFLDMPKSHRPPEHVKLFSPNTKNAFLQHLRGIRDSISQIQLDAVREVYGMRNTEGLVGHLPHAEADD